MAKEMKKRKRAASLLIMVYRFYLRRQLARAARTRQKCRYYLYHRCASIVESAARGRLGRRRARTFENLRYIKHRHPISLKKALAQKFEVDKRTGESKRLKKVFWYHTKVQLDCLYRDYFILCQRTGFVPPRIIVEQNIEEIARRIRVREEYLITLIQALYRGIILRKCLEIYKYEIIRIREIRANSCFRIGTIWRGYVARKLRVPARIAQVLRRKRPEQYARERREKRDRIRAKAARSRLRQLYEKERAEEATARASGLVNPNNVEGGGGKKMAAFLDSAYGSDDVRRGGRQLLDGITEYDARIAREKEEKQARKDWLRKAVADEADRGPKFLRGKIAKDNYNGTYDIDFEDGTKEASVDVLKIKQAEGFPKPSLGHKWKVGMVCMGRYSHKRDLCGHDVNDAGAYKRYYHRDEMSANSQQLIDKLTTFQVKPSHDSRSLLKNHNKRMEKRGRGISFDFPDTLYGDPRAALYEGERSPISPKDSEARVGEFT